MSMQVRHHAKKTSQTRAPLKIYNKNTNSLQLPGSSEALNVYHRICTELYFKCICSIFFPRGLLRIYSYWNKLTAVPKGQSVVPSLSSSYHTPKLPPHWLLPKKRLNGHWWLGQSCSLSPGSFLILFHLPLWLQKKNWQTCPNPEYWSHSGYTSPHPPLLSSEEKQRLWLWTSVWPWAEHFTCMVSAVLPTALWGRYYCPLPLAVKKTKLRDIW